MRLALLTLIVLLSGCSWLDDLISAESSEVRIVKKSFELYNTYNDSEYLNLMDTNINFFMSNGLGTTRFASGLNEFKSYVTPILRKKKSKIQILNIFSVAPWVVVHQKTTHEFGVLESSVSYQVKNGKISDIMVLGEKRISD